MKNVPPARAAVSFGHIIKFHFDKPVIRFHLWAGINAIPVYQCSTNTYVCVLIQVVTATYNHLYV